MRRPDTLARCASVRPQAGQLRGREADSVDIEGREM